MSKSEASLLTRRESSLVSGLSYNVSSISLNFLPYTDMQGFKQFLKITWEPFEAHFRSIETRFIHHTNIVVCLAGAEHQSHFYKKETQDKQKEEGG